MNSWSVQGSDGLIRIRFSLAKTVLSITLSGGTSARPETRDLDQMGEPDVGDQVEVMGDDRDLAPVLEDDIAVGVDLGDLGVRRVVVADRRDVAGRPVGQVDARRQLLRLRRRVQDPATRAGSRAGRRRRPGRPSAPSAIQSWRNS